MELKRLKTIILLLLLFQLSISQTVITSNQSGKPKDGCWYEYWKDTENSQGTMILKEGCNFSCEWGSVNNILFRRGVRPGSRDIVVTYSADYRPTGNSYLCVYGWFTEPLVEYYIVESWGTWRPQFGQSKGTIESDSGVYDIYQNQRTGYSIQGNNTTFQQYYSVRRTKRTSGKITCANHFDGWENKGMKIGKFYEVAFNVEAYQSSGGSADVVVSFGTTNIDNNGEYPNSKLKHLKGEGNKWNGHFTVTNGIKQKIVFNIPLKSYLTINIFNLVGKKVATLGKKEYEAGQHILTFDALQLRDGVYYYHITPSE